jgi:hypothetical protein
MATPSYGSCHSAFSKLLRTNKTAIERRLHSTKATFASSAPLSAKPSRSRGGRGAPISVVPGRPAVGRVQTLGEVWRLLLRCLLRVGFCRSGFGSPDWRSDIRSVAHLHKADPSGADPRLFPGRPYIQNDSPHLKTLWSCGRLLIEPALGLPN